MPPTKFPYTTALVTGVSSGIGQAVARSLAAEGVEVYGTSRKPQKVNLEGVTVLEAELSSPGGIDALIQAMGPRWGQIDLLVNNAGCGVFGYVNEQPADEIRQQMAVMLEAPILLARSCLQPMLARRHGCIVNVSSLAVRLPIPCMAIYNTTKAGLSAFSQALAEETRGSGVAVLDFQPGDYSTQFNRSCRRHGGSEDVWRRLEETMAASPSPEHAARSLIGLLRKKRSGRRAVGSFFQARAAVWAEAALPTPVMQVLLRRHFRNQARK